MIKFFLKYLRILVLQGQREKNLTNTFLKLINENFEGKKINILDYGSGFDLRD